MDEQESLSSILSGSEPATDVKPAEPAAAAPSAAKEPESTQKGDDKSPQARDDSGKFAKAEKPEEKPAEPAAKPEAKADKSEVGALIEMRRRLQAAENRVRELQGGEKPKEKPSVFDNEEAAIGSRVKEGTDPLNEKLFRQSMKIARLVHGESFAEAESAFSDALENDPRLLAAWQAADDPGEYVYAVGLQIRELASVGGDFVKYREKVTGELKGQLGERDTRIKALEAELESLKKANADLEAIPRSLNGKSSAPAPKGEELDDEPLSKVTRFGNH